MSAHWLSAIWPFPTFTTQYHIRIYNIYYLFVCIIKSINKKFRDLDATCIWISLSMKSVAVNNMVYKTTIRVLFPSKNLHKNVSVSVTTSIDVGNINELWVPFEYRVIIDIRFAYSNRILL
jgi:hypothetical protein